MQSVELPANTDIEAFQAALALGERNECDPPTTSTLLRALRVFRLFDCLPHDGDVEVFVAEDGSIEVTAFGNDLQASVSVEESRLQMVVQRLDSGAVIFALTDPADESLVGWIERAA